MKRYSALAVLLGAALLSSCDKNAVQDITGPLARSRVKFFNFGVNAPAVNFYANAAKMTATGSPTGTEATTGVAYGGVGSAGYYSAIAPGQYTLSGKIAATTDKDLAISTVPATIADGKFYSFYQSGVYNTAAKSVEGFVVEDPIPAQIDYSVAYVRFVNAISNSTAMTLYAKNTSTRTEVAVGAAVPYKSAGAFTSLPTGVYDVSARVTGSATDLIAVSAVSFSGGRVYSVNARGDLTVQSATDATRPILSNSLNR